jgi:hypothetical protein
VAQAAVCVIAITIGAASCAVVTGVCLHLPDKAGGRPQPGTPAASYCDPLDHWYRWLFFPIGAMLLALLTTRVAQRSRHAPRWALFLVFVVAVVNTVVVLSLPHYVSVG